MTLSRAARAAGAGVMAAAASLAVAGLASGATGRTTAGSAASTPLGAATLTPADVPGPATFTGPTPAGGTGGHQPAGAATTPASGGTARTVTRQWLETALARRETVLSTLTTSVQSAGTVPSSVQSTLLSQLSSETQGIDALAAQVPNQPASDLPSTASTMVHQYRVYLVMAPKVRIAERVSRQQRDEQRLSSRFPSVEARLDAAAQRGVDVAGAQGALQDLESQLASATSDTGAVDLTAVVAVTASGYPADGGPLGAARTSLAAAKALLPAMRHDVQTIRADLRAAHSAPGGSAGGSASGS